MENPEITRDYLIEHPEEITIQKLVLANAGNLFDFTNNFYQRFSPLYRTILNSAKKRLAREDITDEVRADTQQVHDNLLRLMTDIEEIMYRLGLPLITIALIKDPTYMRESILNIDFNQVQTIGILTEEGQARITILKDFLEIYKQLRAKGYRHWEDLCN